MGTRLLYVVNLDTFFVSHRLHIAQAAIRAGFDVHLVANFTICEEFLKKCGIATHAVSLDRQDRSFFSNFLVAAQIFKIMWVVNPKIVHLITIKPVIYGGLAARILGVSKVVSSITGFGRFLSDSPGVPPAGLSNFFARCLLRLALSNRNVTTIVQNPSDRGKLIDLFDSSEQSIRLIKGVGIDLSHYRPRYRVTKNLVLFAGRLLEQKGVRDFVSAARILKEKRQFDAQFVIAGAPDPNNSSSVSLEELCEWSTASIVVWVGHQEDIRDILSRSTIVCFPSYYGEGFPKILIEAAAMGKPVITTDIPGCRDAIVPGSTGFLVPPRNPVNLSLVIERLINDRVLCLKMGAAARLHAERFFDQRDVIDAHLKIYDEV